MAFNQVATIVTLTLLSRILTSSPKELAIITFLASPIIKRLTFHLFYLTLY